MIRKIFNLLIAAVFCFLCKNTSFSAFSGSDSGTSSGQFLKLEPGARAAAMGSAYTGVSDDSTAIFWNPAGLAQLKSGSISVMHAIWFESITYDWLSIAQPMGKLGIIGLGVQYLNYGSIPCLDINGADNGSLTSYDMAVSLSYAKRLGFLFVGAGAKYISSKLDNTATTMSSDAGIMFKLMKNRLTLGCAVQNLGGSLKYYEDVIELPVNMRIGAGYRFSDKWLGVCGINAPLDSGPEYGAGTEYTYKTNKDTNIFMRAGYNTNLNNTGGLGGISAGLGLRFKSFAVDYAFVPYGKLGDTNRISLNLKY